MTTYNTAQWPALYLDWVNNFLTIPIFAEHYNISEQHAADIIAVGNATFNFTEWPEAWGEL